MAAGRRETFLRTDIFEGEVVTANRHMIDGDHVPHDHDFMEIALIHGGSGAHRTIHGERRIRPGDAFLLPVGVWHAYVDCRQLEVYNCCFGVEILRRELAWISDDPASSYMLQLGPASLGQRGAIHLQLSEEALPRCREHLEAMISGTPYSRVDRIGRLLLLLGELARHTGFDPKSLDGRDAELHPVVREGIRLLEERPAYPWLLAELAERLAVERSYLVRLFRADTGLPPMKYLARHRTEIAANLLLLTDLSVSGVGERVGWPDPNYFARRFKARFGVSATAYRARMGATRQETIG
jgi:AraC family transcriptional regulator, L-rhamnose operon transcriptional activator RhaR